MEIHRRETTSPCTRGYVASIGIQVFKGRRDVLVHLFRPDWTTEEESTYMWSDLVQENAAPGQVPGRGNSREVLLESFTKAELDQIVDYLTTRYAGRLTTITTNCLSFPLPTGLLPLRAMPEGKDIGRIRFEIVPGYALPFVMHGLYDLSQHKPLDQGLTDD